MSEPSAHATIEVAAPVETVYELVSDLPGLADCAEEFAGGEWLDGVTTARVGARFKGVNRRGWRRWSTLAKVTDAGPNRFAFDVSVMGVQISRWQYDIEPTDQGCVVTEQTWPRLPGWFKPFAVLTTGVPNRSGQNQRNIEQTLERLKAVAESRA